MHVHMDVTGTLHAMEAQQVSMQDSQQEQGLTPLQHLQDLGSELGRQALRERRQQRGRIRHALRRHMLKSLPHACSE